MLAMIISNASLAIAVTTSLQIFQINDLRYRESSHSLEYRHASFTRTTHTPPFRPRRSWPVDDISAADEHIEAASGWKLATQNKSPPIVVLLTGQIRFQPLHANTLGFSALRRQPGRCQSLYLILFSPPGNRQCQSAM